MNIYKPNEFAKKIGVTVLTLQRWDNKGVLKANRTPTNRRYYTEEQLQSYRSQSKQERYIGELCDKCGVGYTLKTIDLERCIYKDLGNGYDIEISCVSKSRDKAWIYIWRKEDDRYRVVEIKRDVPHCLLPTTLESIERRYKDK